MWGCSAFPAPCVSLKPVFPTYVCVGGGSNAYFCFVIALAIRHLGRRPAGLRQIPCGDDEQDESEERPDHPGRTVPEAAAEVDVICRHAAYYTASSFLLSTTRRFLSRTSRFLIGLPTSESCVRSPWPAKSPMRDYGIILQLWGRLGQMHIRSP